MKQTSGYAFRAGQADLRDVGDVISLFYSPYLNPTIYGASNPQFPLYCD
ncbi:MAG: hypothetical protein HY709_07295 [Candidatus Latescibacteria bacterium]|nr:hypothetical protein [Candidatus Latescibacterota bacterium]